MRTLVRDYGLNIKAVAIILTVLLLIVALAYFQIITLVITLLSIIGWIIVALLLLPTRHLLAERTTLKYLPADDRRPARLLHVHQKTMFARANLVATEIRTCTIKDERNRRVASNIEIPHFPKMSKPEPASFGLIFEIELPGNFGVTSKTAVKNQDIINGFISYLLRNATPNAEAEISEVNGSAIKLLIRYRDEWADDVAFGEV
jgi:hypothetical protein